MENPGKYLHDMRATAPLVHNITNYVAMNVMANVLLAVGASPAMAHARAEMDEFAGFSQALSVNIGTLDPDWVGAMELAARAMNAAGKPWVLDPVAVGATALRRDAGARLLALGPTIIRGNASEIMALAGAGASGRGADSGDAVERAEGAARDLARQGDCVVAVTGPVDFITDGTAGWRVANGDAMMPLITALGCSLSGVVAAFAVDQPPLEAAVAALAFYGLAGEIAAQTSQGPGTFQPAFLDALHNMTPERLNDGARISAA